MMDRQPIVIGLTGAIGTGKSNVLHTLVSLGAHGIDADLVAHRVVEPGGPAYEPVVAAFGSEILGPDARIDRGRLAARAFGDEGALARLEGIIHPAVENVIRAQVAGTAAPAVVIEAIKLLEAGLDRTMCDQVWVTTCTRRRQFARLASSRGMLPEQVESRLAAQMSAREMMARANLVIDTGGAIETTRLRVLEAWGALHLPFPEPQVRTGTLDDAGGMAAVLNAVVREGAFSVIDRTFTPAQERAFLRRLPKRACVTVADIGKATVGFQVIEPFATYTKAMDHAATIGTFVAACVRRTGLGHRMSEETFRRARAAGYRKIVAQVRGDNPEAVRFYTALGFRPCGRLTDQAFVNGRPVDLRLFEMFLD